VLLLVGDDWAEDHHDVELQDETGRRLGKARLPEGMTGIARPHAMIAEYIGDNEDERVEVVVGIETERGPWVQALLAAGYQVYAMWSPPEWIASTRQSTQASAPARIGAPEGGRRPVDAREPVRAAGAEGAGESALSLAERDHLTRQAARLNARLRN